MDQPDNQIGNAKADEAYDKELGIFSGNIRILAFKCPGAVKKVIGGSSHSEPDGICHILLDFKPFFADIGNPEINKYAGKSNNSEFQEFDQESLRKIFAHATIV